MLLTFGVLMASTFVVLAAPIAAHLSAGDSGISVHMRQALICLAPVIPLTSVSSGFRGYLEARGDFFLINAVRAPVGALTFLVPAVVAMVYPDLSIIVLSIVVCRLVAVVGLAAACQYRLPGWWSADGLHFVTALDILKVGGWLASANLLGWLIGQSDRFIIAGRIAITTLPAFVIPLDLVMRLTAFPSAVAMVLFPFSAALKQGQESAGHSIYRIGQLIMTAALGICAVVLAAFAGTFMDIWLASELAEQAATCLTIFVCGVVLNSQAQLGATVIQATGRARLLTKLYAFECLPYFAAVWFAAGAFGPTGAALAWLARVVLDAILILYIAERCYPMSCRAYGERLMSILVVLSIVCIVALVTPTMVKVLLICLSAVGVGSYLAVVLRPNANLNLLRTLVSPVASNAP